MKRESRALYLLIIIVTSIQLSCSVPRYIWPQKDIQSKEINDQSLEKKVLVASRKSEFKDAVINHVCRALKDRLVYIKLIGLKDLNQENVDSYSAVIILNTCMAWGMDRKVSAFLDEHENQEKMIILTTSGDGDWTPDMDDFSFNAISSASEIANVEVVSRKISNKTLSLLQMN